MGQNTVIYRYLNLYGTVRLNRTVRSDPSLFEVSFEVCVSGLVQYRTEGLHTTVLLQVLGMCIRDRVLEVLAYVHAKHARVRTIISTLSPIVHRQN